MFLSQMSSIIFKSTLLPCPHERSASPKTVKHPGAIGIEPNLEIAIDSNISEDKVSDILQALANYYRACGGIGFDLRVEVAQSYQGRVAGA